MFIRVLNAIHFRHTCRSAFIYHNHRCLAKLDQSYTYILLKGNPRKRKPMLTNHTHTIYLRGIPVAESQSCAANCAKSWAGFISQRLRNAPLI